MVGTGAEWSVTALLTGPAATQIQLIALLEEGKTCFQTFTFFFFFGSQTLNRGVCSKIHQL